MAVRVGSSSIDRDRALVYSVEDAWGVALDRGGPIDFFGSQLMLPVQRVLGDLGALQATANAWLADPRCCEWYPSSAEVLVRPRQGQSRAHYEYGGVIAIPTESSWACREAVLAHELAHHVSWSGNGIAHGSHFRLAMVRMAEIAFGPAAALLLRAGYDGAGLDVVHEH